MGAHGWIAVGDDRSARNHISTDFGATWTQCGPAWDLATLGPLGASSGLVA
jgi:hypothetical protein